MVKLQIRFVHAEFGVLMIPDNEPKEITPEMANDIISAGYFTFKDIVYPVQLHTLYPNQLFIYIGL